ncbi:thiol:disulfide interchange protein DsbC [Arenicella chitinivorans]|uniref:Thiol:disulfide interchange protein n=1 Tax=Arenicella chitinivorans TaxID=1329800 RepID=A0A918RIA2_9GAMM|nr:DsbC family protein [Arenicella chitinivorans]GHA01033.1 thiol:disulfide interchange protein DsbC [Arenicella chitinivorans]
MRKILLLSVFLLSSQTFAQPATKQALLEKRLAATFEHGQITIDEYDSVLKRVTIAGGVSSYFVTHDGQYLFAGPIYDTVRKRDIVADSEALGRKAILSAVPENSFVSYPSDQLDAPLITVITDIDCPYCREFHTQIPELNEQGISVNYLMLPRAGLGSSSYTKTLSALCADDVPNAITLAMQNVPLAFKQCSSDRLNEHIVASKRLKVSATPGMVFPNGELRLGFLKPAEIQKLIAEGSE